jgi:hypothetical protein
MKQAPVFALMLALASIPAFAAKRNPTINIPEDVEIGSTLIPAGDYSLAITGAGPEVQVTLTKDKKSVASFAAKEVQVKGLTSISADSSGKVPVLEAIQLHDLSLVLEDAPHSGQ